MDMINYDFLCSSQAIVALRERAKKADNFTGFVRVGVSGSGGCLGYRYLIIFNNVVMHENKDLTFIFDDLHILVDKKSMKILSNTTLEFKKSLKEEKFVFNNPKTKNTCSCEESFSIIGDIK